MNIELGPQLMEISMCKIRQELKRSGVQIWKVSH